MSYSTTYFGDLSQVDTELVTVDNVSVIEIVRDIDRDFQYYTDLNQRFFASLTEAVTVPQKQVKYYDGEALEALSEAGRPTNRNTVYDYVQEIPFQEFTTGLTLTTRAVKMMTSEELMAYVQAKLTSFQKARFSDFRKAIFTNTDRVVIDSLNKYQTTSKPFYNSDTATNAAPIAGYTFVAGDLQHYTGRSATLSADDVRTKLIDKVRHHGFRQIEIWVSDYEYALEKLPEFVPAENQLGRDLQKATAGANGETQRQLSPWEGLVGFISNAPIIKTSVVPVGYAVAVAVDGGPNRSALLSRVHPVASMQGLQTEVKSSFPLESTIMSDGWGYAANHRGAVAVMQLTATSYTVPSNL